MSKRTAWKRAAETLRQFEAVLALCLARWIVFRLPHSLFRALSGTPSAPPQDGGGANRQDSGKQTGAQQARDLMRARAVTIRLNRVANRLPRESTCLVRALAGRLLLVRRGIGGSVIRLGVRRDNGRLEAHAWLLAGSTILLGGEEAAGFQPLADLATGTPGPAAPGPVTVGPVPPDIRPEGQKQPGRPSTS